MSFLRKRYSSLMIVTLSFLLVFVVGGYFYYLQVKKNENYQSQRYFKELKLITDVIDKRISGVEAYSLDIEKTSNEIFQTQEVLKKLKTQVDGIEVQKSSVANSDSEIADLELKLLNKLDMGVRQAAVANWQLLAKKKRKLQKVTQQLESTEDIWLRYEQRLENQVSIAKSSLFEFDKQEWEVLEFWCESDFEFCLFINDFFEELDEFVSWDSDKGNEAFDAIFERFDSKAELIESALRGRHKLFVNLLSGSSIVPQSELDPDDKSIQTLFQCEGKLWPNVEVCQSSIDELNFLEDLPKLSQPLDDVSWERHTQSNSKLLWALDLYAEHHEFMLRFLQHFVQSIGSRFRSQTRSLLRRFLATSRTLELKEQQAALMLEEVDTLELGIRNNLQTLHQNNTNLAQISDLRAKTQLREKQKAKLAQLIEEFEERVAKLQAVIGALLISYSGDPLSGRNRILENRVGEISKCNAKHASGIQSCMSKISRGENELKQIAERFFESNKRSVLATDYLDGMQEFSLDPEQLRQLSLPQAKTNEKSKTLLVLPPSSLTLEQWHIGYLFFSQLDKKHRLIALPLKQIIPNVSDAFPLLLLSNKSGQILLQHEQEKLGTFQSGLHFENVAALIRQLTDKQAGESKGVKTSSDYNLNNHTNITLAKLNTNDEEGRKSKTHEQGPGFSGYIDFALAGKSYRVFASPISNLEVVNGKYRAPGFYILGLSSKSRLLSNKLTVSAVFITAAVLVLAAILAFLPLIKVRLVSLHQSFSLNQRRWSIVGITLLVSIATIAGVQFFFYNGIKHSFKLRSSEISRQIKQNFHTELTQLLDIAENAGWRLGLSENIDDDDSLNKLMEPQQVGQGFFLEGAFIVGKDGAFDGKAIWSSKKLYRKYPIDLSHRNYFKEAMDCQGWQVHGVQFRENEGHCQQRIAMERVFNKRDQRKNTWFGVSYPSYIQSVLAFGTQLQSFSASLLPDPFSYLVFENNTGRVLYHSQDDRSLIENVFVETENDPILQAKLSQGLDVPSLPFSGKYRGKKHGFNLSSLSKGVPWTLMVLYDKSRAERYVMLATITALVLILGCMALLRLVYLLLRWAGLNASIRQLLWFDKQLSGRYPRLAGHMGGVSLCLLVILFFIPYLSATLLVGSLILVMLLGYYFLRREYHKQVRLGQKDDIAIEPEEQLNGYVIYLMTLLFCFVVIPVGILQLNIDHFYLDKLLRVEQTSLQKQYESAKQFRQRYFNKIIDKPEKFLVKAEDVPCYLGGNQVNQNWYSCNQTSLLADISRSYTWFTRVHENRVNIGTPDVDETALGKRIQYGQAENDAKSFWGKHLTSLLWQEAFPSSEWSSEIWLHNKIAHKKGVEVHFGRFFYQAVLHLLGWLFLAGLVVVLFYWLIRQWVCFRLLGLLIPENFRIREQNNGLVEAVIKSEGCHQFIQVIRPSRTLCQFLQQTCLPLSNGKSVLPEFHSIARLVESKQANIEALLANEWQVTKDNQEHILVIKELEMLAMKAEIRLKALEVFEFLLALENVRVILLVDVAPLFRLTKQALYPHCDDSAEHADAHEVLRWSRVMKRFGKVYDWVPATRQCLRPGASAYEILIHEASSWPECQQLLEEFLQYHCYCKSQDFSYSAGMINLDEPETGPDKLIASINYYWQAEQVTQFFSANAGASYRYRWELCTKEERLVLLQVANGHIPNPLNIEPLEHLVKRGYLFRDNGWHIINRSFKRFSLTAEPEELMMGWFKEAEESSWKYVRIPIFISLFAVLGVVAYSATETFESVMAIMTATLGLIPLLIRNVSLLRGGASGGES